MADKKKEIKKKEIKKKEIKKKESPYEIRIYDPKKMPSLVSKYELDQMNKKIKKKEETGKKDIFDYIGDVLSVPYKIRGGNAKGGLIKGKPKLAKKGF